MSWQEGLGELIGTIFGTLSLIFFVYFFWWLVKNACKTAIKEMKKEF